MIVVPLMLRTTSAVEDSSQKNKTIGALIQVVWKNVSTDLAHLNFCYGSPPIDGLDFNRCAFPKVSEELGPKSFSRMVSAS